MVSRSRPRSKSKTKTVQSTLRKVEHVEVPSDASADTNPTNNIDTESIIDSDDDGVEDVTNSPEVITLGQDTTDDSDDDDSSSEDDEVTLNDLNNSHAGQTKMQKTLAATASYTSRLQQLKVKAAALRLNRQKKAVAKSAKKSAPTTSAAKNDDDFSDSSDSVDNKPADKPIANKKKKKIQKKTTDNDASNQPNDNNFYAPLSRTSDMSKAERKKNKAIQRENRTYFTLKLKVKENTDAMDELIKQAAIFFQNFTKNR